MPTTPPSTDPTTPSPAGSSGPGAPSRRPAPAGPLLSADLAGDAARAAALRRMRLVATGLLVLAAVVYALTLHAEGALGYVNAFAEASMVGAIADWFAVTALFRHPLGLPVPHTALIPRRKDDLGRSLEEFVGDNFLAEPVLRERVAKAEVSRRVATWLAEPAHARRVVDEVSEVAAVALARIREEHVAELVTEVLVPRFREEPLAPVAGTLLTEVLRDDLHHNLVDLALDELHRWLVLHADTFTTVLAERAPWWTPERLNDRVTARVHTEVVRWVVDIRDDPHHRARAALDELLGQLAQDLLHDPDTAQRCERLKERLLDHPQLAATSISLWQALRRALLEALRDPDGTLRQRLVTELTRFAGQVAVDEDLQRRADAAVADGVVFAVDRYGTELTSVITHTVEQWDGKEAASRIELLVGKDLQFIRINGTVVGGLVGLLIHALSELLG